jgi:hypothetical protein
MQGQIEENTALSSPPAPDSPGRDNYIPHPAVVKIFEVYISSSFSKEYCNICYLEDKFGVWPSCCKESNFICFGCFQDIARKTSASQSCTNRLIQNDPDCKDLYEFIIDCPFCRQKVTFNTFFAATNTTMSKSVDS